MGSTPPTGTSNSVCGSISKDEAEQNQPLAAKHKVRGYSTVLLLTPDKQVITRTGYRKGGPEAYVEFLESEIAPYREHAGTEDSAPAVRQWTTLKGSTIQATLVSQKDGWIELKTKDGGMSESTRSS